MKVNIEVDLSPEEARKLMGLPDVEPMQKELMAQIQEKMQQEINSMTDSNAFMERYMPMGMQGLEQFQKMMGGFASSASGNKKK